MEPRFGHDFSKVRVHSDNVAAQSARAVDALAYTVDFHVVLDNQFLPAQSYRREKVLAHELAHVVQQSRMPAQDSVTLLNDSGLESQADNSARQVMRGHQTTVSSSGAGLMRTPRSLNSSLDPSAMTPAEIADEIDEINQYLQIAALSQETIDHLSGIRQQLLAAQQRRSVNQPAQSPAQAAARAATTTGRTAARSTGAPFFGLQAADNAFRGIQLYYTASVPSGGRVDMDHLFRRGPYLIVLNHIVLPDGNKRILYYNAFRRPDTIVAESEGWNEYAVGPDSIELFLTNLTAYVGAAGPAYMFGPPSPYQAASGRTVQRVLEGNFGEAVSSLGEAWSEAVRDPGWWAGVVSSAAGALGEVPGPRVPGGVRPAPPLRSLPGGRPGPIPMRPGVGGRPVVASPPRPTIAPRPVAQAGPVIEGGAARSLPAPAAVPEPVPVAPPRPALAPQPAPGPGVPPPTSVAPVVGAAGAVGTSVVRPQASTQSPAATSTAPAIQIGTAPDQRRNTNQTCRNDALDTLQAEKDRICNSIPSTPDWSPSRSQKMLNRIKCSEIQPRIDAFRECLRIRQQIQDECFGGVPDAAHTRVMNELQQSVQNGLQRLQINCAPGHPMANL